MASQQDDNNNNNSQQPATRRVVVWENEWPVFRHFARSLLKVRDWVLDTTHETREIAEEATQRTTQVTQTSIRHTMSTARNIYTDHPFYVLSVVSLSSMLLTRRYTKSIFSLFRNGVIGYGAGAALLYPKCFAAAVSQPREFFEKTVLVHFGEQQQQPSTTAAAEQSSFPSLLSSSSQLTPVQEQTGEAIVTNDAEQQE